MYILTYVYTCETIITAKIINTAITSLHSFLGPFKNSSLLPTLDPYCETITHLLSVSINEFAFSRILYKWHQTVCSFSFIHVIKFIWHKINYFKVDSSLAWNIFTMLCNSHLYLDPKHFDHPKRKPCIHEAVSPFPSLLLAPNNH